MPPHPLPGMSLASLPIRTWGPQMAVNPSSRTPPSLGPSHTLGIGATLAHLTSCIPFHQRQQPCWGRCSQNVPQGSASGHLLFWTWGSGDDWVWWARSQSLEITL